MTKFISKSSNLMIVIKPGIPAQPITGTPATPTLSVKFQDGMVDIHDVELVELMKRHPAFNSDFILASDDSSDPFAISRVQSEPAHINTELKHGTPVARVTSGKLGNVSPEMAKLIKEQAVELAKQMLPEMVKTTIEELVKSSESRKSEQTSVPDKIVSVSDDEIRLETSGKDETEDSKKTSKTSKKK